MYSIKLSAKMMKIMTYILHPLPGDSLKWKMKQLGRLKLPPKKEGEKSGLKNSQSNQPS